MDRLYKLERIVKYLYCQIKNNSGIETDPVFTNSVASELTETHLYFLNTLDYNSLNNTPESGSTMITTDESEYNLAVSGRTILITFFGDTTNLILPSVSSSLGQIILLYNGGSGNVTISSNNSDGDVVIDGGMTMNSTILTSGSPMTIFSGLVGDQPRWITKP